MGATLNFGPILMKFGMDMIFHEKIACAKNGHDRTTSSGFLRVKKFFFFMMLFEQTIYINNWEQEI